MWFSSMASFPCMEFSSHSHWELNQDHLYHNTYQYHILYLVFKIKKKSFEAESHLSQAGLKVPMWSRMILNLLVLLPPFPLGWDHRHAPPCPVCAALAIKSRVSFMSGKHSPNRATSPAQNMDNIKFPHPYH